MRPPKTIRQHLLHGSVPQGKPERPSKFVGGRPKIPSHLSPSARAEFKRCVHLLEARGTVTPGDFATLTVYAEVFARWIAVKTTIGDEYMIKTTRLDSNGTAHIVERLNPLLKVAENCEGRMLSLVKSLGLTPVDREKSKPTNPDPENEIIPGSMGDVFPELFDKSKSEVLVMPTPVAPEDMICEEEESDDHLQS